MKSLVLFLSLFYVAIFNVTAQTNGLTNSDIEKIRSTFVSDSYTKGMQNALSGNDIQKIALNRSSVGTVDHLFKYRVSVSGITNQKSSGRCWMFTSLNIFRPIAIKKYNLKEFEFSQNYLYFWDILEKSNLFLNNIVATADKPFDDRKVNWYFKSPIDDGGVWNSFVNLVKKYGLMPKEIMPETNSSENTSWMIKLIARKVREDGLELRTIVAAHKPQKQVEARKLEMLTEVYRMLALNLGQPPKDFQWRYKDKEGSVTDYKKYTPQSFRDEVLVDVNLDDYVMVMNDPTRPYYKHYEIENYRNTQEGKNWHYVNLPNDEIKRYAIESIKNNEALYASCDVAQQLNRKDGILDVNNYDYESVYGIKFGMDKKARILTGESGSSHGMALIAVDVNQNGKPLLWQFENSWGNDTGHEGYLTFTDAWFDNYMFRFVIPKKYLDSKIVEIYNGKAELLPPWDPMF
ncbi:MAG: C1 family peptidase [Bacteroidota bacterium]|nr:C1 family peptidase [Bacteroidota bacterium]